jgi:hypothetical protein
MVSERPLCEEKVCVGIELVRAPGSCVTGAGGGLRVAKGRIGTVTQEYANGAANIRTRRGRLPAIGLPSALQSSLSSILRASNLREMLRRRQTHSLENLGESRVGA